ncbi:hypothetical protein CKM354_000712200 [Cercospora kikuchii]|uniref:Alternative oxidase n=1 Tax=Cercospora kikuchii TaxID=84275 RepID=A0A9P3CNW0_9PEZI|nr:uncharacterized protein CKM354_000712200 [Cercospora kikuchii]GIZ43910.1 hypothetical protein CKM354_000712200 [Cercospora kikuchii]
MIQMTRLNTSSPRTLAATFFVTLLPLYFLSYQYRTRHPYGGSTFDKPTSPSASTFSSSSQLSASESFIQTWLSTHLIDPYNPAPLAAYCNSTSITWHPNLVFNLHDANGGIGNVRGNVLDFLFTAIEMGASIILPGMASRQEDNLSNVWGGRQELSAMFDEAWLVNMLGKTCPEMKIYKIEEGMEMVPAVEGVWTSRTRRVDEGFGNTAKEGWEALKGWLSGNEDFKRRYGGVEMLSRAVEGEVVVVNLGRTLWDMDTRSLPRGLRRNFGQLVKVGAMYKGLAALVVWRLVERFGLDLDPSEAVPRGQFYGAHLRTADDAKNAGWMDVEGMNASAQMEEYIGHAKEHKLRVIYVASGNIEDVERLKQKAATEVPQIAVVSKTDLLPAHEASALSELSWDQQALVDWEVLKRCSVFGGIVKSSFAYNIAMTRNQYLEDRSIVNEPWAVLHSEHNMAFDDGLSRIFGRDEWHERRIPRGMWP